MKTIIKLTNEYASNLNALFFNFDSKLASYYDMFDSIFKNCFLSDDKEIVMYDYSKTIDIVFIKMNNISKFEKNKGYSIFIQSLRTDNELLPIYIIKDNITDLKVLEMIDSFYYIDGHLPTPFDGNRVYRFLYRILKRLIIEKELNSYMEDLENKLFTSSVKIPINEKMIKQSPQAKKIDKCREKDIRFSQTEKISAREFMNSLDDSIIDKVENMEMELDALIDVVYRLENSDNFSSVVIIRENIEPIIKNVFILVESMGYFDIAVRAFGTLNTFLATLTEKEFENKENKTLFITMLLAIINDLEKWLQIIFIDNSTDDIHYLDASFSSNILEIEQIFLECDENDDDLEFF